MKILAAAAAIILFFATDATAQRTNDFVEAIIQGRKLALQILTQRPAENFTNTGALKIRDAKGKRFEFPIKSEVSVKTNGWQIIYEASYTNLTNAAETLIIFHPDYQENLLKGDSPDNGVIIGLSNNQLVAASEYSIHRIHDYPVAGDAKFDTKNYRMFPFAGSDFYYGDLGLEFFHWPQQKVIKKENHRSCGCIVLESTNPSPTTNSYSRVVSWIDSESLGIVEAYAYDVKGKLLKDFYPKDIKKVNGQWQVQTLVMENVQTGSRSRLEFDLKK